MSSTESSGYSDCSLSISEATSELNGGEVIFNVGEESSSKISKNERDWPAPASAAKLTG